MAGPQGLPGPPSKAAISTWNDQLLLNPTVGSMLG